jgi:hypothetical protein
LCRLDSCPQIILRADRYELVAELMELPAVYDVSFGTSITKEDLNG